MTDRTVSVRLRMLVRDYTSGASEADRMTRRLRQSQEALGSTSRKTGKDMTSAADAYGSSAKRIEDAGARIGRATALTAAGAIAAGGALQYIAPAAVAAGAAAGTLPGILGGVAASMGTAKVASIGLGDVLEDLFETDDPFSRLSPRAKALVAEVGRLKPQLIGMQQSLQDAAYATAAGNLDRLATTTLPVLGRQALLLAEDWSDAMTAVTDTATDPTFLAGFTTITNTADRVFDDLNARIKPLGVSFATLAMSADPLVRLVGDRMVGALDRMSAGIQRAKATGDLDEFFASGAESAGALLSIAGDLLSITGQVVGAVNSQNSSIKGTAESLDAYLASGRSAEDIAGIVDTLTAAYEGTAEVLGPLGSIARDALADPATRDGLEAMFDILALGSQTLRLVFDLFSALPDPVQSVVVVAIGLGVAAQRTTTMVAALGVAAQGTATKLGAMGLAGQGAGRALSGLAATGGRVLLVLAALQLVGAVMEQFEPAAANVDAMTGAVERFAKTGEVGGELARVFGDNLDGLNKHAAVASSNGFLAKMGRAAEAIVPPVKSLNEIFQGGSFTEAPERFQALDAAISQYAKTTNDTKGTNEAWNRVLSASGLNADELTKLLPRTTEELGRLNNGANTGVGSMAALETRTKLLAGGLREAVTSGRSLLDIFNELNGGAINSAEAQIQAEEAVDNLSAALKKNGKALNKQGTDFDINTQKGRDNKQGVIDLMKAGAEAAQAKYDETGSIEAANDVWDTYVGKLRTVLGNAKFTDTQIATLIATFGKMPELKETPVSAPGAKGATQQVKDFNFAASQVPHSKTIPFVAGTAEAKAAVEALKSKIAELKSKHIYITGSVRWTSSGNFKVPGGTQLKDVDRWGGIHTPKAMAAGGITQAGIYPASSPPLIQFAEPETGGEAYIPRRGDRNRNLAILTEAAAWNKAAVIPMAAGGVTAAASGLVTVGPSNTAAPKARGTALESIDAYIQARDAIDRLNKSLKENGRSFSLSTAKGRENYSALISSVKAAEDAAQAKYDETGSVRQANKAYDAHIAKLRAMLKQQKVSASTINALLKTLAKRPTYDTPDAKAPVGSEKNIAAAEARISAEEAMADLADHFSLVKPTFDFKDETGRDNLGELFDFLKAAEKAAQTVLEQTGSSKSATAVYDGYVAQLRKVLGASGLGKAAIDALLNQYGKIVLTPNMRGGVYARNGLLSLSEGGLFGTSGSPLYGFAEPGTGGEMFLPRLGSRRRGEDLLSVGAGWYGGRYLPSSNRDAAPNTITNTLTVHAANHRLTISELQGLQRQMDARARIGRKG